MFKFNFKELGTYAALVIVLIACGEKNPETASVNGGLSATSIAGTWSSDCLSSGDQYESKSITFTEKSFSFNSTLFNDSACTTANDKIDGQGEYLLGSPVAVTYVGATTAIDYTFFSYTWTFVAKPADAVDYGIACNKAVVSGSSINVLDKVCKLSDAGSINFFSPAYGVVFIDADEKMLITDASSNGGTPEERSTSLRIDAGWTKSEAKATAQ